MELCVCPCMRGGEGLGGLGGGATIIKPSFLGGQTHNKAQKIPPLFSLLRPHRANMTGKLWLLLSAWLLLPFSDAGRQMPKLSDKKLCADSECSREYSPRRATFLFPLQGLRRLILLTFVRCWHVFYFFFLHVLLKNCMCF